MNINLRINGVWISVDVSEEVYHFLVLAKRKEENLRHEQRRHWDGKAFDEAAVGVRYGAYITTPEQWFLRHETTQRIQIALARCTPTQRKLLLLYALEGCSYGEIARATGYSKSTVYEIIQAARKKCKKYFESYPND